MEAKEDEADKLRKDLAEFKRDAAAEVANDTHISVRFQEMGISDFGRPDYALHYSSLHLL